MKMGMKLTIVVNTAVVTAPPTSTEAWYTTSRRDAPGGACRSLWTMFSHSTMPMSDMVPTAMAMPDRETMLASMPKNFIAPNPMRTARGISEETRMPVRRLVSMRTMTMIVIRTSWLIAVLSVSSVSPIRAERS